MLSETLSLDLLLFLEAGESKQKSWRTDRQQLPNFCPNPVALPGRTNQNEVKYSIASADEIVLNRLHSMFQSSWFPKE